MSSEGESARSSLRFVEATTADADRLLELMREFYTHDHLDFDESRARSALAMLLGDRSLGRAWVMMAGESTVGYAVLGFIFSLEFGGRSAFVDELYIRDAYRGKGLGRAALEHLEEECRRLGFEALRLEVNHANLPAVRLYERYGFERHERYLMTKRLR